MKKILFISYNFFPPFYSGKLIISGKRLADLDSTKFKVVVLTSGLRNSKYIENNENILVLRSPYIGDGKLTKRLNIIVYWVWSLIKLLLEKDISIIHFDECGWISFPFFNHLGYKLAWSHFTLLAKISKRRKIPTIFEHAISDENGHFAPDKWKKRFLDQIDHVVCISDALFESAKLIYPQKSKKIINGIEDNIFLPISNEERLQLRKANGYKDTDIILCFVGLVVRRKGFDLISSIFPQIYKDFPEVALWVIGPRNHLESRHIHDDEVEGYQRLLEPVKDRVKFFGNITDRQKLAKLIAATDIFLFPTRQEGFGLAPAEAMACGVPPIITRIPGVTDLANIEGETGLYINPDNKAELGSSIIKLITDKPLREKMGRQARVQIERHFSWKQHVSQWESLYNAE